MVSEYLWRIRVNHRRIGSVTGCAAAVSPTIHKCCSAQRKKSSFGMPCCRASPDRSARHAGVTTLLFTGFDSLRYHFQFQCFCHSMICGVTFLYSSASTKDLSISECRHPDPVNNLNLNTPYQIIKINFMARLPVARNYRGAGFGSANSRSVSSSAICLGLTCSD